MQKVRQIIPLGIAVIIGITIGYFSTQWQYFSIVYEIDIIPTSIAILTLLVGIYIASVIQKRISNSRVEKDIVINRLNEIRNQYKLISREVDCTQDSSKIVSEFKTVSKLISALEKLIKYYCGLKFNNRISGLKAHHFSYKRHTTNAKVDNLKFAYGNEVLIQIDTIETELLNDLDEFVFEINRY